MEKISVIIPSYNHNRYLVRAVGGALNMHGDKDIIVIDDGSDIPVKNVWGNNVTVLRHKTNAGLSGALNTGIAYSSTDKFVICAADDILHPKYIENMIGHNEDIISCDMLIENKHAKTVQASLEKLKTANCHSYAALIKKEIWFNLGGYKPTMNPSWEDYEFFLNAAKNGYIFKRVPLPLHIYNRNPDGRDAEAQGKDYLLLGKLHGYHQDVFGKGKGLITFVIPCYNHEKYLEEAINSCLTQVYPHIKVVVVDDESPGDVQSVLKKIDNQNVYLIRQKNKHLSGARNTGIKFAIDEFNTEYLVMLDADDSIHKAFVEKTLSLFDGKTYIYSNIKLIGDAWHDYELPDFSCGLITKNHIHPCTFLMPSKMYQDVLVFRGYGYDESMKQGYEDWEFSLAALKSGWCGLKHSDYLFNYRNHAEGSMRTAAEKMNKTLYNVIKSKHPWITNKRQIEMACKTCGGRAVGRVYLNMAKGTASMMINVPGIGEVSSTEPIQVQYTGQTTSEIRKIGRGLPGQGRVIYKFSANPNRTNGPLFVIVAIDTHLFNGPYIFSRLNKAEVQRNTIVQEEKVFEKEKPRAPVKEVNAIAAMEEKIFDSSKLKKKAEEALKNTVSYETDDLTKLSLVGEKLAVVLREAGINYYRDVLRITDEELTLITKLKGKRLQEMKNSAQELLK